MAYNPNVPATGHTAAQDYVDMQGNFAQIQTSYDTDHIPLNSGSNIGCHQKVTFGINSVPSSPVSPPVMFTNVQDGHGTGLPGGVPQLFFYSGTQANSQNQYKVGTSGSVVLPMGIIMKWGTINFAGSSASVTFSDAFPTNILAISVTSQTSIPATNGILSYGNQTTAGFTAYQNFNSPLTATYIAIGN